MIIELMDALYQIIVTEAPKWLQLGIDLLVKFMQGIASKAGEIAQAAVDTLTAFLNVFGLPENVKKVVDEVGELLLNFITAITNWINDNKQKLADAGEDLGKAILGGVATIFKKPWEILTAPIEGAANWVEDQWNKVFDTGSPSKRMIPLGENIVAGIGVGFGQTDYVDKQISRFGDHAESSFQKAIRQLADNVDTSLDMSPTITPVMDMTAFEQDAKRINSTLGDYAKITPTVSYNAANDLASQYAATTEVPVAQEPTVVNFEYVQQNTSPASLSTTEIYRQTKNQLSTVKRALEVI
jgi:hypothetical protein